MGRYGEIWGGVSSRVLVGRGSGPSSAFYGSCAGRPNESVRGGCSKCRFSPTVPQPLLTHECVLLPIHGEVGANARRAVGRRRLLATCRVPAKPRSARAKCRRRGRRARPRAGTAAPRRHTTTQTTRQTAPPTPQARPALPLPPPLRLRPPPRHPEAAAAAARAYVLNTPTSGRGVRSCAVYSEHRVNARGAHTAKKGEGG